MDVIFFKLLAYGGVAVVFVMLRTALRTPQGSARALERMARHRRVLLDRTTRQGAHTLREVVDGVSMRLRVQPGSRLAKPYARLLFDWGAPGLLWLDPEAGPRRRRVPGRLRDIVVGDALFDRTFLVRAPSEAFAREVLDHDQRTRLLQLAALSSRRNRVPTLGVMVGPPGVILHAERDFSDRPADLDSFVELGTAVFRGLRVHAARGVEVVQAGEGATEGQCPVCGDPLEPPVCRCIVCRTPHHAECWDYFGSCAIYACAGDEAVRDVASTDVVAE